MTTTALDPLCGVCGRPVIGTVVWGAAGPYHPECVGPPRTETLPPGTHFTPWVDYRLAEMQEREIKHLREKLEKLQDWTQKEMDRRFGIQHSKVNRLEDEKTTAINKLQMQVDELERQMKIALENISLSKGIMARAIG